MRAAIATLLCICFCQTAAGQAIPLRYGQAYSALQSIFALPILVAEREGYFFRAGLDFGMVPVPGGGEGLITALHDGTADISHVATPFLVRAALAGSDAVAIVAEFNNPVYSLVAKPENVTYADLKGKLIGVAAETGSITASIRKLLTLNGLRKEDYRTRFVDGTPERFVCLTAGDCDAVPLGQPHDFVAMRRGYRLLGLSTEAVPEYLYTVTAARRSWAAANKDTVVRYVSAVSEAFKFIRDPARRGEVLKTIVDTTGFAPANAQLTLALYLEPDRGVLPKLGEINIKGMEQAITLMGESGVIKVPLPAAERFVDLQYLRAAGVQ
jgi:ABC-type nitrate/sulfonate/bicarbonate transport system substrate-binding protein